MRQSKRQFNLFQESMLAAFFFGLFAHGYAYSNSFFAHDSLLELASNGVLLDSVSMKISVGRFMQPVAFALRGNISAPWLMGCLSLFWSGMSTLLLTRVFRLSTPILVAGLLVTQLSVTYTHSFYIHEVDMFALGFFMACLALYVYQCVPYGRWLAPFCVALACGFYQAYFSAAVLLFQALLFQEVLEKKSFWKLVGKAMTSMTILFFGLLIYYGLYRWVVDITGTEVIETYNQMPHLFEIPDFFTAENFWSNFMRIHEEVFLYFINPVTHYNIVVGGINTILFFLFLFILVLVNVQERLPNGSLLFLFLMFLTMPFGGNISSFFAGFCHELMVAPLVCAYFFVVIAVEKLEIPIASWLVYGLIGLIFWQNVIFANQLYLKQQLAYDNTLSTMTRVLYELEQEPDYVVGETPILFIGLISQSEISEQPIYFDHLNSLIIEDHMFSIRYYHGHWAYFTNILGYPMNFSEDYEKVYSPEVQAMPSFPYPGYCQMIDGTIVLKMS